MGHKEAVRDGIRFFGDLHSEWQYVMPCSLCGANVYSWCYVPGRKYLCVDCRENKRKMFYPLKIESKRKKLENAVIRIGKQGNNLDDYAKAIEAIGKLIEEKPNWFQSTEEIMVALQLYKRKIPFNHQVRINSYIADFILPKDKIVLEVDGTLFHSKERKLKEPARDEFIKNKLGNDWEVIRVSDDDINKRIKHLPLAIRLKYKNRQRLNYLSNIIVE